MRRHLTAIAAAALVAGAAAVPAQAQVERTARFWIQATGVQTTKWTTTSGTYTDCNGEHSSKGEGTEVLRFDSGKPEKIVFEQLGSSLRATYDTWDPRSLVILEGIASPTVVTRRGQNTRSVSGGWCSGPVSEKLGPYDCGRRRTVGNVSLYWKDLKHVEVDLLGMGFPHPFQTCPIATPPEVSALRWTKTVGRLSAKLLFGGRRKIVVEDGDRYRRDEPFIKAFSTTAFRITLVRAD